MCVTITTHIRRVFAWDLAKLETLPAEATKLEDVGIMNDVLTLYLAWRHSMLLVSLPALFISSILEWTGIVSTLEIFDLLTPLGKVVTSLPSFASTVLFIAVVWTLCGWTQWRKSALILKIGWLISFVMAFLPALFPLEFIVGRTDYIETIVDDFKQNNLGADEGTIAVVKELVQTLYESYKISFAIGYAISLFPVLVTLPTGLARATHKIRGLLPEAILSGWILIISVPFYSVINLMALILLIQVSGNAFLLIGALLLFCAPWIYIFRRRLYTHAPTEKTKEQIAKTQKHIRFIILLAYFFILIWVYTGILPIPDLNQDGNGLTVNKQHVSNFVGIASVFNFILSYFGRTLVTTVVFSDILLRMTVTNWRQDKSRRAEDNGTHIDTLFESIESAIRRPGASEEDGKEEKASERVDASFVDIDI